MKRKLIKLITVGMLAITASTSLVACGETSKKEKESILVDALSKSNEEDALDNDETTSEKNANDTNNEKEKDINNKKDENKTTE